MNENLFCTKDIILIEDSTQASTIANGGFIANFPSFLDTLLQLHYFSDREYDVETANGHFKSWCYHQYFRIPYSFRSIYILFERGHYLESLIIVRHVIEVFVQLRFFFKYPERLYPHLSNPNKRVSFRKMFDEFSSDFYSKWYIKHLSSWAHGGVGVLNFRFNLHSSENVEPVYGTPYDEFNAGIPVVNLIAFMYGYINFFPVFFPDFESQANSTFLTTYNDAISRLESYMNSHKEASPGLEWFNWIDPLIKQ